MSHAVNRSMTGGLTNDATLARALLGAIQAWPRGLNAPCLVSVEKSLTASEVLSLVQRQREHLKQVGVSPGDKVIVTTGRGHVFWIELLALWTIGAVAVPIEPDPGPIRLAAVIEKAAPKWQLGTLADLNDSRLCLIRHPLDSSRVTDPEGALTGIDDILPDDLAVILFTSGSTGEPKGVALSHRAVLGNARATRDKIGLRSSDLLGAAIPFRFVSALSHFLVSMLSGASYAGTDARLPPAEFVQYLLSVGCTAYGGSPLQARWIADWLDQPSAYPAACRLRWIMCSGDYFQESIGRRLMRHIPDCTLIIAYGLTESAGRMCCRVITSAEDLGAGGTVGSPIDGLALNVFDDDMTQCPPGKAGKIFVKGAYLFGGYVGSQSTSSRPSGEAWFETGDYGHSAPNGDIVLQGRSDDVFKVAGVKVSGVVIAEALLSSGKYADVAIVPRRYPRVGSVPHVYYVPATAHPFSLQKTMRYLRGRLPPSHLPWGFSELSEIPRTGSGKIDRRALRSAIAGRLSASGD